jgi:transposase
LIVAAARHRTEEACPVKNPVTGRLCRIPDNECLVPLLAGAVLSIEPVRCRKVKIVTVRLGVDVACKSAHQASCADERGEMIFVGHKFRTDVDDLERLWARLPADDQIMVVMEPTRNAWVPLAAWFRRHGADVVMVPSEQSADLRAYYNKHSKTDRLDSQVLARLPLLHPDGLYHENSLGPGEALKRAVKMRSGLVHRRTTSMQRLDALLEIMGPAWTEALGSDMRLTALRFLARYGAHPRAIKRLGKTRLTEFLRRSSRQAWGSERATAVMAAVDATLQLWGTDGMDFDQLAADIAAEARLALSVNDEIHNLDQRIAALYEQVDPDQIVRSVPGVGAIGAPQIAGRLGDASRFANLAAIRSFAGLVPHQDSSGIAARAGGPTKAGDACLREALFTAADHARKIDPTIAARYHRLMTESGKHHNSALCTIAAVLLTRIAACLRDGQRYQLRDTDGAPITEDQGRAIVTQRYTIPARTRVTRRQLIDRARHPRRNERAKTGVAKRSEAPPVPQPA